MIKLISNNGWNNVLRILTVVALAIKLFLELVKKIAAMWHKRGSP